MTKWTKWPVHPAKTQISLDIRPVWSESSLSTWKNIRPFTYWAHSEDSGQMPRLIWVFVGRTSFCWYCQAAAHLVFVGFVWKNLYFYILFIIAFKNFTIMSWYCLNVKARSPKLTFIVQSDWSIKCLIPSFILHPSHIPNTETMLSWTSCNDSLLIWVPHKKQLELF